MIPLPDISRICLGSLLLTTCVSYITVKFNLIEKVLACKSCRVVATIVNISISVAALMLMLKSPYVGLVGIYLSCSLWAVQFSRQHSAWVRPLALNATLLLMALMVLWWFDSLSGFNKLKFIWQFT